MRESAHEEALVDQSVAYLLHLLEERFDSSEIKVFQRPGTQRSIDLPQDYDPQSNQLHRMRGVMLRVRNREFFFPADWVDQKNYGLIEQQILSAEEKRGEM